ncbi:MAG: sulfatase-like hydrolase/transferase, partial [Verrucomicrobiota bacterium]
MKNLLTLVLCLGVLPVLGGEEKPNILFILIDDFGYHDVGYNGSTFYETPEIDNLSTQWMRFDQCYTPSPMCSPTRLSILTGKHPARHGVTQWLDGTDKAYTRADEKPRVYCPKPQSPGIKASEHTMGEAFQAAGYDTAFYGKWHMGRLKSTGGPAKHGYASQKAVIESNRCSMFHPFRGGGYFPESKQGDCYTDLLTDAAIDFVSTDRDQPFYLHLCYFAMHAPIEAKSEYREKFAQKAAQLPDVEKDRVLDEYGHQPQALRQFSPEYAGELYNLDANLGRLIHWLKDQGLYENTIIVLTGDNGGRSAFFRSDPTSNQPLRTGKTFLFDGGLRTPMLLHWPRLTLAGKHTAVPVTAMDFYPTLLEMAGLP